MGRKQNKYDVYASEKEEYHEAGETCMHFLERKSKYASSWPKEEKITMCTKILDHQKPGERFSDTYKRLGMKISKRTIFWG